MTLEEWINAVRTALSKSNDANCVGRARVTHECMKAAGPDFAKRPLLGARSEVRAVARLWNGEAVWGGLDGESNICLSLQHMPEANGVHQRWGRNTPLR